MRVIRSASMLGGILLLSVVALPSYAQEQGSKQVAAHLSIDETIVIPPHTQTLPSPPPIPAMRPRLGKSFWLSWAAVGGLTIVTNELTIACVHRPGCSEGNPLFGSHPGRPAMYGVRGGIDVAGFFLSRRLRRKNDRWWKVTPAVTIPAYAAETAWDAHALASSRRAMPAALVGNVAGEGAANR